MRKKGSRRKLYRKTCNLDTCGKKYKGSKTQIYCCVSHRVLAYKRRSEAGYYSELKKILALELSYVAKGEVKKVVECCVWAVKRWRGIGKINLFNNICLIK